MIKRIFVHNDYKDLVYGICNSYIASFDAIKWDRDLENPNFNIQDIDYTPCIGTKYVMKTDSDKTGIMMSFPFIIDDVYVIVMGDVEIHFIIYQHLDIDKFE